MYRVGIVGCGGIAQVHAQVLRELPDTELTACADVKKEKAAQLSEKYGCRAYASMEEMLEKEKLDAVHLCTPHYLHAPMALYAAEKGLAVFTEKPPIISREQWTVLEEAARKAPLGVCFQNRYNPNVQKAAELIQSGEWGRPLGARAFVTWQRDQAYYAGSGWRGAWDTEGGGALINQAIHTLDLLVFLLGRPSGSQTFMANRHLQNVIQVEDTVEAHLTLGGVPALLYASNAYAANAPVLLEVQLEKAALRLEDGEMEIRNGESNQRLSFPMDQALGKGYWGNGHLACIRDFYRCLSSGAPYMNRLDAVRDTAMLLMDMYDQGRRFLTAAQR